MTDLTTAELLGKNIAERRRKLGFSQKYLSVKLGISQESMARIEKGIISPKVSRLEDIARTLNCTIPALFEKCPNTPDSRDRAAMLEEMLRPLPDDAQEALLALISSASRIFCETKKGASSTAKQQNALCPRDRAARVKN